MSTTTGPTIHKAVEIDRLAELKKHSATYIDGAVDDLSKRLQRDFQDAVAYAYRSGIIDGFQQGVLAAAKTETEPA